MTCLKSSHDVRVILESVKDLQVDPVKWYPEWQYLSFTVSRTDVSVVLLSLHSFYFVLFPSG